MKLLPRRGSPRRKAWIIRYFVAVVVLVAVTWVAMPPVSRAYRDWKKTRALAQAEEFLAAEDFSNAKLALDVALAAKPGDPQTLRVAANLLEQVGAPEVMPLRRRLVQVAPESTEDHAALVLSALRFNDLNAARDAMRGMTPEQANEPAALRAALAYAQATNNLPMADLLYNRLRELEPENENLQVLHATLRLNNPTAAVRDEALAELEALKSDPRQGLFVLRQLLVDAMARQNMDRAKVLARELRQAPGANLDDHLHSANLALNIEDRPFEAVFAEILPAVEATPEDTATLLRWLILVGEANRARSWLVQQDDALKSAPAVLEARADLAIAQSAWDRLADLLESGVWGPVNRDTVRLAFSARLAAQRENEALQDQIWSEALVSASSSLADLTLLYRLASIWSWEDQAESPLWVIARNFPSRTWAHQTLYNVYRLRRDTESMQALIGTLRLSDTTLPRYQYDWALLSMLLSERTAWTEEKQTMQTLYESNPDDAYYATGYAFALAQSEREEEAVEIADQINELERNLPERAPYLAFVYATAMRPGAVDKFATNAEGFDNYLPEESQLLQDARNMVR